MFKYTKGILLRTGKQQNIKCYTQYGYNYVKTTHEKTLEITQKLPLMKKNLTF